MGIASPASSGGGINLVHEFRMTLVMPCEGRRAAHGAETFNDPTE
jgi:hypothetical protein